MANIRAPEYGVEKTELTLTSQDPASVLYGVNPNNKFIPIKVTADGSLVLGSSLTLDASDVQIGAVEIKNYNTDDRVFVSTNHEMLTQARLYDAAGTGLTSTLVTGKQALDVNITNSLSLTIDEATSDILVYGWDGAANQKIKTNVSGELQVGIVGTPTVNQGTSPWVVSGTVTANQGGVWSVGVNNFPATQNVNVTNATLAVTQSGVWSTRLQDGSGNAISSTAGALDVNIASGVTLEVNLQNSTDDVLVYGQDAGTINRPIRTNTIGQIQAEIVSSVLPTGAATEATLATRASESSLSGFRTDFNAVDFATETTLAGVKAQTDQLTFAATRLLVDGSGVIQPISASSLPLPTGAATEATLATRLSDSTFTGRINTLGQKTMANSTPVVLASDQTVIPVSDNGGSLTVDGTVAATQSGIWNSRTQDGSGNAITSTNSALDVEVKNASSTGTTTTVSRSNTSQTLLAANSSRKGATIYNDAAANLFIKLGATASTSSFTVRLQNTDYYEVPFNYTGVIDGIWASNGAGDAKITELT